ncbi:MAG: glycosyltransferase family A protein [FCB group bacterium]|jgi:hypothetical protein|nr:glycosyltransferase family A protein [FCB group bacterium]
MSDTPVREAVAETARQEESPAATASSADLQRIPPVRGILPLHNHRGKPIALLDQRRWLRLNRLVFKSDKVDLLAFGASAPPLELFGTARELGAVLSWRTDCASPPPDLKPLRAAGLHDIFLTPLSVGGSHFFGWLAACREAGLPVRVQLLAPLQEEIDAGFLADAGVRAVNLAAFDPFQEKPGARNAEESRRGVEGMNALVDALEARGIEANLVRLPFCQTEPKRWPNIINSRQFFLDHQQYQSQSYEIARGLYRRGPVTAGKAILMLLAKSTVQGNPIDDWLLPWLLNRAWLHARVMAWRKLTRHLRFLRHVPKEIAPTEEAYAEHGKQRAEEERRELGPVCAACRLRRICDRIPPELNKALPGLRPLAQEGELVTAPLCFAERQHKYYDAIDAERHRLPEGYEELAESTARLMVNNPPTRLLGSQDYGVQDAFFDRMEGGVRWFSFSNAEKLSTPLARLEPPFTVSTLVAGGMADFIGFSLGRFVRLLCPMEGYRHEIGLHVDAEGRFVLLRDGLPVRPAQFDSQFYVPLRLGGVLEPRLSLWNIDGNIVTQTIRLWEHAKEAPAERPPVKYSILIVCTRYARRLQATLRSIVHQRDFDLRQLEIVIGYVPGLDAVDDILDSLQFAFPELRIVRSPFPPERAYSKGFMINESARMVSGEWIVLMDADILLHPDTFAAVEREKDDTHFLFPDGRKMLTRETTGKVLLGEIEPWNQWRELMDSPGEHRRGEARGIPIGYFQAVRTECFNEVGYQEVEHFEWADMQFGIDMRAKFGIEKRLSVSVAHLDHGGSRWYGTQQHF